MIISKEQIKRLKDLLTEDEYNEIISCVNEDDIEKFQDLLNDCIVMRFVGDDPTKEAWAVQRIYDEVYNQN